MNIFEKTTGITGNLNDYGGNLPSFLAEAKEIRRELGKQGYLLDNYLSMLLESVNTKLSFEAAEDGFGKSADLRLICTALISQTDKYKEHSHYKLVQSTLAENPDIQQYQEPLTQMNLLYTLCFHDFVPFAAEQFLEQVKKEIGEVYDAVTHRKLYQTIAETVGTPAMELFNLQLRQCFLAVPLLSLYMQGFTNDLLYCLTTRDKETSKQIFQLLLDMPNFEV